MFDQMIQRVSAPEPPPQPQPVTHTRFPCPLRGRSASESPPGPPERMHAAPGSAASSGKRPREEHTVDTICEAIRAEEGKLKHLWDDPDMAPVIVQYYPGFHAYASHVSETA